MNNGNNTAKIIISALAAVSVILFAIVIMKFTGVFDGKNKDTLDAGNEVANYGIETTVSGTNVSDGDTFIADTSTIEMDEIPNDESEYATEPEN